MSLKWMDRAACKGVDENIFFPSFEEAREKGAGAYSAARAFCKKCCVKQQCADWILAIERHDSILVRHGCYAGMSPKQRKKIDQKRLAQEKAVWAALLTVLTR